MVFIFSLDYFLHQTAGTATWNSNEVSRDPFENWNMRWEYIGLIYCGSATLNQPKVLIKLWPAIQLTCVRDCSHHSLGLPKVSFSLVSWHAQDPGQTESCAAASEG